MKAQHETTKATFGAPDWAMFRKRNMNSSIFAYFNRLVLDFRLSTLNKINFSMNSILTSNMYGCTLDVYETLNFPSPSSSEEVPLRVVQRPAALHRRLLQGAYGKPTAWRHEATLGQQALAWVWHFSWDVNHSIALYSLDLFYFPFIYQRMILS